MAESTLHLQVGEMRQLFNAMDPAPFRERDIDPNAQAYIVDWAQEVDAREPLTLNVTLSREPATPEATATLGDAVHAFFRERARVKRLEVRRLFRRGRVSLVIGLLFLGGAIALGEFLAGFTSKERYATIIQESLVIGGWVALWRPLEIFLYEWWPMVAEVRLFDRLGKMHVDVIGTERLA